MFFPRYRKARENKLFQVSPLQCCSSDWLLAIYKHFQLIFSLHFAVSFLIDAQWSHTFCYSSTSDDIALEIIILKNEHLRKTPNLKISPMNTPPPSSNKIPHNLNSKNKPRGWRPFPINTLSEHCLSCGSFHIHIFKMQVHPSGLKLAQHLPKTWGEVRLIIYCWRHSTPQLFHDVTVKSWVLILHSF